MNPPENTIEMLPASAPSTNAYKTERFDEDNLKAILQDERYAKADRLRLGLYFKTKRSGAGTARVKYVLGKNYTEHNLGRLLPENGLGLQNFRWDIRNPLVHKNYWDTDFENCHYNIALKTAERLGIDRVAIRRYCEERDACLRMVCDDRGLAKMEFLKCLYGGDITLHDPNAEDKTVTVKPEGRAFLVQLGIETARLAKALYDSNTKFHKIKSGAENKPYDKRANGVFALMSTLFQTEERKCLLAWDEFLYSKGRSLDVYIHDGGLVAKLEGEMMFPPELLEAGAVAVAEKTGYQFRITTKTTEHNYVPPVLAGGGYERMKRDFERNNFLVGSTLNHITPDGLRLEIPWEKAKIQFAKWNYMEDEIHGKTGEMKSKKVPFLGNWLTDPERKDYERCDFIPNRAECPPSVFNLFHGFAAEDLPPIGDVGEVRRLAKPIYDQVVLLTSGEPEFFLHYLANIVQTPDKKSDIAIFLRDMGSLMTEGGGTGKNLLLDWFGNKVLGEEYYHMVGDNSTLYGSFNSPLEGKILVVVEEASGKDNFNNVDKIKSMVTSKTKEINKKCVAQYRVKDYARYLFCSNNRNPLPVGNGNRRFGAYDTDNSKRGDKAYFESLVAAMADPRTARAFYEFLMMLDIPKSPVEFQNAIPLTPAYIDIRRTNAPVHYKWLVAQLLEGTLPQTASSRELYTDFTTWYTSSKERSPDRMLSETAFGLLMNEAFEPDSGETGPIAPSRKTSYKGVGGTVVRTFDMSRLIAALAKLHFISPEQVPAVRANYHLPPVGELITDHMPVANTISML